MLRVESDPQADAIYVYLSDEPVAHTKELDENRLIDYSYDGTPVGIDLLGVSNGVDVEDLPEKAQIERILEGFGIRFLV